MLGSYKVQPPWVFFLLRSEISSNVLLWSVSLPDPPRLLVGSVCTPGRCLPLAPPPASQARPRQGGGVLSPDPRSGQTGTAQPPPQPRTAAPQPPRPRPPRAEIWNHKPEAAQCRTSGLLWVPSSQGFSVLAAAPQLGNREERSRQSRPLSLSPTWQSSGCLSDILGAFLGHARSLFKAGGIVCHHQVSARLCAPGPPPVIKPHLTPAITKQGWGLGSGPQGPSQGCEATVSGKHVHRPSSVARLPMATPSSHRPSRAGRREAAASTGNSFQTTRSF